MRREVLDVIFTVGLLALIAWATFEARQWDTRARLFPWAVGFPLLVLTTLYLVTSVRKLMSGDQRESAAPSIEEGSQAWGVEPALAWRRTLQVLGWLAGFAVIIWALGFAIGGTLATFLYLRTAAREGWIPTAAVTGGTALFFWLMLTFLHVPFPRGYVIDQLPI
jgi:hypothetical protein